MTIESLFPITNDIHSTLAALKTLQNHDPTAKGRLVVAEKKQYSTEKSTINNKILPIFRFRDDEWHLAAQTMME